MKRLNFNNTDAYINATIVYAIKEIKELLDEPLLFTNMNCSVPYFLKKLVDHEHAFNRSNNPRLGVILTLMLPIGAYHIDDLKKCLLSFMKKFKTSSGDILPYYAIVLPKGKGRYIQVYICEREFYPKSKTVFNVFKKNIYRNKLNGKMCKETDQNAILYKKAGDIDYRNSRKTRFSSKYNYFKFASNKEFQFTINKWKIEWQDICKHILKANIETKATVHKFQLENLTRNQIKNARNFNKALELIEISVNSFLAKFNNLTKMLKHEISKFLSWIKRVIQNGSFKIGKVKFKICLNYHNLMIGEDVADCFFDYLLDNWNKYKDKINKKLIVN